MTEEEQVSHNQLLRNLHVQGEFKGSVELERYLTKLRADGLSERTIQVEHDYLKICLKFIGKQPHKITMGDIDCWKYEMLVNRKYEPDTVYRSILCLRKFLRFLGRNEVAEKLKLPRRPSRLPPEKEIWLLPEEQCAMINKSKEMGIRNYAIIKLFLSSGVRAGELMMIDSPDIDFENQTILVRHGKGDKSRIVCFDRETKDALIEYLKIRGGLKDGSQALFLNEKTRKRIGYGGILKLVKECAILAGINKKISPHKLRHTFITNVIERTKDITLAQKLAGHTDIKVTMRYHHSTHEEVVAKYKEYFDDTPRKDKLPPPMTRDEIVRALDTKFIKGELPYEAYIKLRAEYATKDISGKVERCQDSDDVAYR